MVTVTNLRKERRTVLLRRVLFVFCQPFPSGRAVMQGMRVYAPFPMHTPKAARPEGRNPCDGVKNRFPVLSRYRNGKWVVHARENSVYLECMIVTAYTADPHKQRPPLTDSCVRTVPESVNGGRWNVEVCAVAHTTKETDRIRRSSHERRVASLAAV